SGSFVQTQTSGPPGQTGFYSATINAYDGELVVVHAENSSYEGFANSTLAKAPSVTEINVTLNKIKGRPLLSNVVVDDEFPSPPDEIDLVGGGVKFVNCTGNVKDNEGYTDITNLTAVFYDSSQVNASSTDDNNNHYTNSSCALYNCSGTSCNFTCGFEVWYYANANESQSWICEVNATDTKGSSTTSSDSVSINSLLAISFPGTIDYGVVKPKEVSNESKGNVTNLGNVVIDIALEGYARSPGDNYSMNCTGGVNISIGFEKYNLTSSNPGDLTLSQFEQLYKNLTSSFVNETSFDLDFRKNDTFNEATRETYWRIYLSEGLASNSTCSGFVQIAALRNV
ncbi:hypothetical protein D6817_05665, partial [Candidatus Pacearchaeota archaeon]